ncbi:MAG: hypothetical protein NWF06_11745 [Candidatus Bathyarchaeota archaeon]|nr:hypothetical protein [Candidatus Bathyarchaeum sp.]
MKWGKFWSLLVISCVAITIMQGILYLLAYIKLFTLFSGILIVLLSIPLTYTVAYVHTKYQYSKSVKLTNKIAFIVAGAFVAPAITLFTVAFIALATGFGLTNYIGGWGFLALMYIAAPIIGASITYWIGKRRNFMPYV